MRSLFLAWRAPNRGWFPIGRLDANKLHYEFGYTKGALAAQREVGFAALLAFPDLKRKYVSSELFPLFDNRVLDPSRKNFDEYLESLGVKRGDPIEILSLTGGERQTDSFEVFPKIQKQNDNTFSCRFFLHGLRHVSAAAQARAESLKSGDDLGVSLDLNGPKTGAAIQLTAREDDYLTLGWAPHYLVSNLIEAIFDSRLPTAKVVRVNSADVPASRRILVELSGTLPPKFEPMSSAQFQLITEPKGREHKAGHRRH